MDLTNYKATLCSVNRTCFKAAHYKVYSACESLSHFVLVWGTHRVLMPRQVFSLHLN